MYDDGGAGEIVDAAAPLAEPVIDSVAVAPRPRVRIVGLLFALLAGLLVGAIGTAIHRSIFGGVPVGLIVAILFTICVALLIRALGGLPALAAFAVGWLVAVHGMSLLGPGGDVIVIDPAAPVQVAQAGVIWTYLGTLLLLATLFLPRRWFARPTLITAATTELTSDVGPEIIQSSVIEP